MMDKFYEDEKRKIAKKPLEESALKHLPSNIYKIMNQPQNYLKALLMEKRKFD